MSKGSSLFMGDRGRPRERVGEREGRALFQQCGEGGMQELEGIDKVDLPPLLRLSPGGT